MSRLKTYTTLKQTKEFSFVYHNAKKFHTPSVLVFYKKSPQKRVGFTASKKVGNAVERNLSKRKLRASFIDFQDLLQEGIFVFVAKKDLLTIPHKELQKNLKYAFKRIGALKKI